MTRSAAKAGRALVVTVCMAVLATLTFTPTASSQPGGEYAGNPAGISITSVSPASSGGGEGGGAVRAAVGTASFAMVQPMSSPAVWDVQVANPVAFLNSCAPDRGPVTPQLVGPDEMPIGAPFSAQVLEDVFQWTLHAEQALAQAVLQPGAGAEITVTMGTNCTSHTNVVLLPPDPDAEIIVQSPLFNDGVYAVEILEIDALACPGQVISEPGPIGDLNLIPEQPLDITDMTVFDEEGNQIGMPRDIAFVGDEFAWGDAVASDLMNHNPPIIEGDVLYFVWFSDCNESHFSQFVPAGEIIDILSSTGDDSSAGIKRPLIVLAILGAATAAVVGARRFTHTPS